MWLCSVFLYSQGCLCSYWTHQEWSWWWCYELGWIVSIFVSKLNLVLTDPASDASHDGGKVSSWKHKVYKSKPYDKIPKTQESDNSDGGSVCKTIKSCSWWIKHSKVQLLSSMDPMGSSFSDNEHIDINMGEYIRICCMKRSTETISYSQWSLPLDLYLLSWIHWIWSSYLS
jgi:hypothetical protein